jgi:hypothetical protein
MAGITRAVLACLMPLVAAACTFADPGGDRPPTCPSIDDFCRTNIDECIRDWATAGQPSTWCLRATDAGSTGPGGASVRIRAGCGAYNTVWLSSAGSSTILIYDAGTGELVGVSLVGRAGTGSVPCVAGLVPESTLDVQCGTGQNGPVCGSP